MTDQTISEEQYNEARAIAATYERERAEQAAIKREAYKAPVVALVNSPAYLEVYAEVERIVAEFSDDGFYSMPTGAIATIMKNLATQAGFDLSITAS